MTDEPLLADERLCRAILDSLPDMTVFVFGSDLRYRLVAGTALSSLGWTPSEVVGRRPVEILGEEEGAALEEHFRAALAGEVRHYDHPGIRRSDIHWSNTIAPFADPSGEFVGGIVISREVSALRRAEAVRRRLEESAAASTLRADVEQWQRERLEFLNEINEVLATCRERRQVMRAVTHAAVPRLGDWCSIYVFLDPHDPVPAIEVAHSDPEMESYARQLMRRFPYDPRSPVGVPEVIRSGKSRFYRHLTEELFAELGLGADQIAVARELALSSVMIVPLIKRRNVVGAMQFITSGAGRTYGNDDVTLAETMAGRVASSLDNCRLSERQREIAQTLQRSLLPNALPVLPGTEVAVRYWAAGEGTEVGGDFYDVFETNDDVFAVVIGDVCGNGPQAASLTALARHNVRANAWRGDAPADVLRHLNEAIVRTTTDTFCTLVVGLVDRSESGVSIRLANGGHPPPVVVPRDGEAAMIQPTGPLVGAFPESSFGEGLLRLSQGDTLVLYTDGVTDLPSPGGLDEDELLQLVTDAVRSSPTAEATAGRLSEILNDRTPFSARSDDVAMLILRVNQAGG